jgi:hypothetical protein
MTYSASSACFSETGTWRIGPVRKLSEQIAAFVSFE